MCYFNDSVLLYYQYTTELCILEQSYIIKIMFYCDIYSNVAWFMTVKIQIYNSVLITQCLKMEFTDNH